MTRDLPDFLYQLHRERKLRRTRPYLQVGLTDGAAAESFPAGNSFDTVVCLNVVEHLEDDVVALRNIRSVLEKDGRAVVLVPNGPWLHGTLDQVLGHRRRYTREQLIAVGQQAGLLLEALPFNRIGVVAWWLNGRVLRRKTFGLWQIKMLNLLTPLFRKIDRWLPLPPLSLIAIFRNDTSPECPAQEAAAPTVRGKRTQLKASLGLSSGVRQAVKRLLTVRCISLGISNLYLAVSRRSSIPQ